jgi:hypothetical protein
MTILISGIIRDDCSMKESKFIDSFRIDYSTERSTRFHRKRVQIFHGKRVQKFHGKG